MIEARIRTHRRLVPAVVGLAIFTVVLAGCGEGETGQVRNSQLSGTAYTGGQWFNGETFQSRTVYVVHGRLTDQAPGEITDQIDLAGGYVIPPLAEGHIHYLNRIETVSDQVTRFLDFGVYYVMVQGAMFNITPEILERVNRPDSVDVIYAQCPLTVPT